jgi:hypothetical protein
MRMIEHGIIVRNDVRSAEVVRTRCRVASRSFMTAA